MGMLGTTGRIVRRWTVWGRLLIAGEALLTIRHHYTLLTPAERSELKKILRKSKGRPKNLSAKELGRLKTLVEKAEFGDFVRDTAANVVPLPIPGLRPDKKK